MLSRVVIFIFSFKAIEVTKSRFSKFQHSGGELGFFKNLDFVTSIALKLKINITTRLSMVDYLYLDPFYSGQMSYSQFLVLSEKCL
jgi:hypothetical protein